MHASRNIALCTKDCVCLFICPTGATDTETGQIDAAACLDGCRLCVDACPSHAIYLVADSYPEPRPKTNSVSQALTELLESKASQESVCASLSKDAATDASRKVFKALAVSNRILAEDCARESGFILPQSQTSKEWLSSLAGQENAEALDADVLEEVLALL